MVSRPSSWPQNPEDRLEEQLSSLELSTRSLPASRQAHPGDVRTAVRRSLLVHRLPTVPARVRTAGRAATETSTGAVRLPSIATLHRRARLLLGLTMVSAVLELLTLGWLAAGPVTVIAGAALVTFLQGPVRVTA